MNELALFAGAGGGILGGKLLGWRTVCAVELDPYAASVLCARQNDGILPPFPIWDDVRTFDGTPWRGIVDVVSGGFPCQDISCAGKGKGLSGERSGLWREMARIIGEVRPRYAFIENSPMLVIRGLEAVLCDLAQMGYDAAWGIVSATDVGAPHLRKRIWIMADAHGGGSCVLRKDDQQRRTKNACGGGEVICHANSGNGGAGRQGGFVGPSPGLSIPSCGNVADADRQQHEGQSSARRGQREEAGITQLSGDANESGLAIREGQRRDDGQEQPPAVRASWWATEPALGRVANGVAARVDRLRAIGNGQVPAVARRAWQILAGAAQEGGG